METIALYIGYIVIGLIGVVLIGLVLLFLWSTAIGIYRIIEYKQTSHLIKKYEAKAMYKACKVATQFLISKGIHPENTLEEAQNMIEKYRRRYKIKED